MRYFDRKHAIPGAVQREAKAWLVRLTSGEATTEDADAFRRWCDQSPLHAAAFSESKRLWQALGPAIYAEQQQPSRPALKLSPNLGRRAFIGAALAGAAYLAVRPAFDWPTLPGMSSDYHTATGEQKQFVLGPDVTVEMNTQTQINLRRPSADAPGIELVTGEAQVLIRTPAATPFTLYADGGEARASQAHFNVRHVDNDVCVTCLEGRVWVVYHGNQSELAAGQQLTYNSRGLGRVVGANEEQVSAWRKQLLIFDHQPLSRVVEEINRYRSGKIILVNQALGRRIVQARFTLNQLAEVTALIRDAYGARVTTLPGGIVLLS
jgi:transmembrane sensor